MNQRILVSPKLIKKKPHFSYTFFFPAQVFRSQIHHQTDHLPSPSDLGRWVSSLQACALQRDISKGKEIHSLLLVSGFLSYPFSTTSLINLYSKCGCSSDALAIFYGAGKRNVFIWNAIVAGFVGNGLPKDALQLFAEMRQQYISPDAFTFPCVIKACTELSELGEGKKIHASSLKFGCELDVFVASALINFYLKFCLTEEARKLFDELPQRDVVLWNSVIHGYAEMGEFDKVMEIFHEMLVEGLSPSKFTLSGILSVAAETAELRRGQRIHGIVEKIGYISGVVVSNSLIDMYGKCKMIGDAREIFERMEERDIFSWNSIIYVSEQSGDHDGTLKLFDRMRGAGVQPDSVTISAVLPACSYLAALLHGKEIHGYMTVNGLRGMSGQDVYVNNGIMDMYVKCGSLRDARLVFDRMKETDVASWNIMIMGYGLHGLGDEALDLFATMCSAGVKPDEVTFIGMLSACSHVGLVDQGREILDHMEQDYGVVPTVEHYACGVDMLGRAGLLDEAYRLVNTMPIEANPVVWRAFLAACRVHGDAARAEEVAHKLFELDPGYCGSYVLMSNIYGVNGRHKDVLKVRRAMVRENVRKTPGCSWIELNTGVHVFITGDCSHPESDQIYAELHSLTGRLCEFGYAPNFSSIFS